MRREVRATANRLANFDDANLRRSARAAVAAGARVERALEILGERDPRPPAPGRPAAAGAQAGLPRGARPAQRAGAHQGRDRRPDPPAAGHGRQAGRGARHPRHRGVADAGDAGRGSLSQRRFEVTRHVRRTPSGTARRDRDRVVARSGRRSDHLTVQEYSL